MSLARFFYRITCNNLASYDFFAYDVTESIVYALLFFLLMNSIILAFLSSVSTGFVIPALDDGVNPNSLANVSICFFAVFEMLISGICCSYPLLVINVSGAGEFLSGCFACIAFSANTHCAYESQYAANVPTSASVSIPALNTIGANRFHSFFAILFRNTGGDGTFSGFENCNLFSVFLCPGLPCSSSSSAGFFVGPPCSHFRFNPLLKTCVCVKKPWATVYRIFAKTILIPPPVKKNLHERKNF